MFGLFNELAGMPLGMVGDARALSAEEIERAQIANAKWAQQATFGPEHYRLMMNWAPPKPEPQPLDERFADFKKRLAAALEKRGLTSASP